MLASRFLGDRGDRVSKKARHDPQTPPALGWWSQERLVAGYLVVFAIVGLVAQAMGSISAEQEGSPLEYFTSGLLWMLSLVALLSALQALPQTSKSLF